MRRLPILVLVAAAGVVAVPAAGAGATPGVAAVPAARADAAPEGAAARANPRLRRFRSCGTLLGYARRNGVRLLGSFGGRVEELGGGGTGGDEQAAAPAPAAGGGGERTSLTNVQEAGVDEPDVVKAVGSTVFALTGDRLHALDASATPPRVLGTVRLQGFGHQLLVHGGRALVLSGRESSGTVPGGGGAGTVPPSQWLGRTLLSELDVADPAAMRVVRTLEVEGSAVSARLTGATARVVISSSPRGLAPPDVEPGASRAQVRRAWRRSVRRTRSASWLPGSVLRNRRTGRARRGPLVRCRQVRRARAFSGLDTITVLTVDLDKGLPAVDADALMTGGDTVYASAGRLFVASERWLGADPSRERIENLAATGLHAFDTTRAGVTAYTGSGEVPGYLLNQWSLSEQVGILRVATTDMPPWRLEGGASSESAVRTLQEREGRLVELGRVGGLGRDERIYAVRFMGDTAYVVTFRQTDPLYVVDLSDPLAPKLLGELKVPGYSAYLHPVGEGLLLGVGQDATDEGRLLGVQLSLFDVTDRRNPARVAQRSLGSSSWTEVEEDHHAFLWWAPQSLAVLPVLQYDGRGERQTFGGTIAFRVSRAGIEQAARLAHPPQDGYRPAFRRAVVVGDRLLALSEAGVLSTPVAAPGPGEFVRYPG